MSGPSARMKRLLATVANTASLIVERTRSCVASAAVRVEHFLYVILAVLGVELPARRPARPLRDCRRAPPSRSGASLRGRRPSRSPEAHGGLVDRDHEARVERGLGRVLPLSGRDQRRQVAPVRHPELGHGGTLRPGRRHALQARPARSRLLQPQAWPRTARPARHRKRARPGADRQLRVPAGCRRSRGSGSARHPGVHVDATCSAGRLVAGVRERSQRPSQPTSCSGSARCAAGRAAGPRRSRCHVSGGSLGVSAWRVATRRARACSSRSGRMLARARRWPTAPTC